VWTVAVPSLTEGDVDCLSDFAISVGAGFGKEAKSEVSHHAEEEAFTLQASVVVGLGADPQVWDVEGEPVVGKFGRFPGATELLMDPVDVICSVGLAIWLIGELSWWIEQVSVSDQVSLGICRRRHVGEK